MTAIRCVNFLLSNETRQTLYNVFHFYKKHSGFGLRFALKALAFEENWEFDIRLKDLNSFPERFEI